MSFLTLFALVCVAISVVCTVAVLRARRRAGPRLADDCVGIQGWLAVLALGVTILPFKLAASVVAELAAADKVSQVPNGTLTLALEGSAMAGLALLSVVTAVMLWRRRALFKRLFVVQWTLLMAFAVLDPVFIALMFGLRLDQTFDADSAKAIGANLIALVWVVYVLRSRRVACTLVR